MQFLSKHFWQMDTHCLRYEHLKCMPSSTHFPEVLQPWREYLFVITVFTYYFWNECHKSNNFFEASHTFFGIDIVYGILRQFCFVIHPTSEIIKTIDMKDGLMKMNFNIKEY